MGAGAGRGPGVVGVCEGDEVSEDFFGPINPFAMFNEMQGKKTIGTCKECKHWRNTFCCSPKLDDEDEVGPVLDDGAGAWGYEGDRASIQTGPNFGCIHWEEK